MERFVQLIETLENLSGPADSAWALARYFRSVPDDEKTIAVRLLYGAGPRGRLNTATLKQWAAELSGLPQWLLEATAKVSGDTAETLALLLPGPENPDSKPLIYRTATLQQLHSMDNESRKTCVIQTWKELGPEERYIFNKMLCGRFRSPVVPTVLAQALSEVTGTDPFTVIWRLHRDKLTPGGISYLALAAPETAADTRTRPYPFLSLPPELKPETPLTYKTSRKARAPRADGQAPGASWLESCLGPAADWSAQRKWNGIPAQIIRREGQLYLWAVTSRSAESGISELVNDYFPELRRLAERLPEGTVLEGELLGLGREKLVLLPASGLEKRIGRKSVPSNLLKQLPAAFLATDCLEFERRDIRNLTWRERRTFLESLKGSEDAYFRLSPQLVFNSWRELAAAHKHIRESGAEGFLLHRLDGPRLEEMPATRWLWKAEPYTFRGVLLYARRQGSETFTSFSLGAWDQGRLRSFVTVDAIENDESEAIADFIRENTAEKFGPVRTVKPGIVFEIAFDRALPSGRHRSGLQLHGARILRWLKKTPPEEAGMLKTLQLLCKTP